VRIYRLDDRGIADQVLGVAPKAEELADPGDISIDERGRILVTDAHTQAVHVFDSQGKRLFVCTIEGRERCESPIGDAVHVSRDGTIRLAVKDCIASFDLQGKRLSSPAAAVKEPTPELGIRLIEDTWRELDRADPEWRALFAIDRRPDGKWFESASVRALAPGGTRILLESAAEDSGGAMLCLYSPKNEPLGMVSLGGEDGLHSLCVSSRWFVVGSWGPNALLVRAADRKVFRFKPSVSEGSYPYLGQTPDGRTLLVLDGLKLELARYELP